MVSGAGPRNEGRRSRTIYAFGMFKDKCIDPSTARSLLRRSRSAQDDNRRQEMTQFTSALEKASQQLQLMAITAAQGELLAGVENHDVFSGEPGPQLRDAMAIDDHGTVNADKIAPL